MHHAPCTLHTTHYTPCHATPGILVQGSEPVQPAVSVTRTKRGHRTASPRKREQRIAPDHDAFELRLVTQKIKVYSFSSSSSPDHKQEAIRAPGKMNGYVNGDSNEFELSDNEEFSDSYDSLTSGIVDPHGSNHLVTDEIISARGETQLTPPRFTGGCVSNRPANNSQPNPRGVRTQGSNPGASSAGSTGGGNGHSTSRSNIPEVNEQIAIAILRLQQSMEQVCNRLDSLETRIRTSSPSDQSSMVQAHSKVSLIICLSLAFSIDSNL